jgi:TusA-related sulfurtransferase
MTDALTQQVDRELDLRGEVCPYTFVRSKLALEELESGQALRVLFDHAPAVSNVSRSMEGEGHSILDKGEIGEHLWHVIVVKR